MADNNLLQTADDFRKGGWLVAILGILGAVCRLLLTDDRKNIWHWVRRMAAGGIIGVLSYFAVHGLIEPLYEAVFYSIGGAVGPELLQGITGRISRAIRGS